MADFAGAEVGVALNSYLYCKHVLGDVNEVKLFLLKEMKNRVVRIMGDREIWFNISQLLTALKTL
jgi:hypothetical protein